MKLKYIENVNKDYPNDSVMLLFEFKKEEIIKFSDDIKDLLLNNNNKFELDKKDYVIFSDCILELVVSEKDLGIKKITTNKFNCSLSENTYQEMMEKINPFIENYKKGTFQYLYDLNNPIEFILSTDGSW